MMNKKKALVERFPSEHTNFTHSLTRVAVAQICQSVGYTSAKTSALQTLTSVAALYLRTLTTLAASNANRFGRTESNLLDIVVALEDLGSVKGFVGRSKFTMGLLKSWVLKDVVDFVDRVDEIPFAQAIRCRKDESFGFGSLIGVKRTHYSVNAVNIPMWLPRFPDPKTYKEEDDDDDKGGKFWSREVFFSNGRVDEVSVSGNEDETVRMRGGYGGELRSDRFRVKFMFGKKKRNRLEVDADVLGNGVYKDGRVGVPIYEKDKELTLKEIAKEKKVYVKKRLLSKSVEKRIMQQRREVS